MFSYSNVLQPNYYQLDQNHNLPKPNPKPQDEIQPFQVFASIAIDSIWVFHNRANNNRPIPSALETAKLLTRIAQEYSHA